MIKNAHAARLISQTEALPSWPQLPMNEQIALRAMLRRIAEMATRGGTTAEDWQQLAGFAEWATKPSAEPVAALSLADATVHGQWIDWHGGVQPVADDVRVDVRFRNGHIEDAGLNAAVFSWKHYDNLGDIVAYRIAD